MFQVETKRLRLLPLHLNQLRVLKENRSMLEMELGLRPSNLQTVDWIMPQIEETIDFWIESMEDDPTNYLWHTNWEIILKEENRSIGNAGFSGIPDENGETAIGYSIDLNYHNQGFMTEGLNAIITWANRNSKLKRLLAETYSNNFASHRVLNKNGFKQISEDEEAGIILWGRWMGWKRFLRIG